MNTIKPASSRSRTIRRIVLGSLAGGLAAMTMIRLPGFLIAAVVGGFGRPGFAENWQEGLASTVGSILAGVIWSPWGWIGLLIGGLVSWRMDMNASSSAGETRVHSTLTGEILLGMGMTLTLVSVGIFPSVMVWMLALFTFPTAVILLLFGVMGIRRLGIAGLAAARGIFLLSLAFAATIIASLGGTCASCSMVKALNLQPALDPGIGAFWWLMTGLSWLIAVPLVRRGFAQWTDFSQRRARGWCLLVAVFPAAAFLLHFTLACIGLLPLSA